MIKKEGKVKKEVSVLFNDALNIYYLLVYGVRHVVKDQSDSEVGNLLPPLHGLLFEYLQLAAWVLLYLPSPKQDSTYHSLCYTSHGALVGVRNSSMGTP